MSTAVATKTAKSFFEQQNVKDKFNEIMGKRGTAFVSSVMSLVTSNNKLAEAQPQSIYMCAMMAATLDLPVNQNLGFAYIIPYKQRDGSIVAQFQLGAKGFKQLALRSGQFKMINDCKVFEGQLISEDPLKGFQFDFTKKKSDKVIGYASYFALTNGFEKTFYMTVEEVTNHAKKYSKTFSYDSSTWKTDFDAMALKTVTKLNLSKNAPLSVEMQQAQIVDQSVIKDVETLDVEYTDAGKDSIDHESLSALYESKKGSMKVSDKRNAERILKDMEEENYMKLKNELEKID